MNNSKLDKAISEYIELIKGEFEQFNQKVKQINENQEKIREQGEKKIAELEGEIIEIRASFNISEKEGKQLERQQEGIKNKINKAKFKALRAVMPKAVKGNKLKTHLFKVKQGYESFIDVAGQKVTVQDFYVSTEKQKLIANVKPLQPVQMDEFNVSKMFAIEAIYLEPIFEKVELRKV